LIAIAIDLNQLLTAYQSRIVYLPANFTCKSPEIRCSVSKCFWVISFLPLQHKQALLDVLGEFPVPLHGGHFITVNSNVV
jgi:hypothetical protein